MNDSKNNHFLVAKINGKWAGTIHIASCGTEVEFGVIVIGQDGKPSSVSTFIPNTPDELRRHRGAQLRREIRRKYEDDALITRSL